MIGSGIPISQSNTPFPNVIEASIPKKLEKQRARVPLVPLQGYRTVRQSQAIAKAFTAQHGERTGRQMSCYGS
jgi:hypothetical protein